MDRKEVQRATDTMIKNLYPDDPEPSRPIFEPDRCVGCGSEEWTYLGRLGKVEHFRCRLCGLDASVEEWEPDVY